MVASRIFGPKILSKIKKTIKNPKKIKSAISQRGILWCVFTVDTLFIAGDTGVCTRVRGCS